MEPFDDPVLGRVEWETLYAYWFAHIVLPDGDVAEFEIEGESDEALQRAREAFIFVVQREDALRNELAEWMLEEANSWRLGREPLEPEITLMNFAARIKLANVTSEADGSILLTYSDGGMFGDHAVVVRIGIDRVIGEPALWG